MPSPKNVRFLLASAFSFVLSGIVLYTFLLNLSALKVQTPISQYASDSKTSEHIEQDDSNTIHNTVEATAIATQTTQQTTPSSPPKQSPGKSPFLGVDHSLTHLEIFSSLTTDGRWFSIDFRDHEGYNPSIIPHPDKNDTWFAIAQASRDNDLFWYTELICEATFKNKTLQCTESPLILPIASTMSTLCNIELSDLYTGPRDARVFHGPNQPFVMYGTQSQYCCSGQWIHDFRRLANWRLKPHTPGKFLWATDLQRPQGIPNYFVEKNWFPFWDDKGEMYIHHDIYPKRSYRKINFDTETGIEATSDDIAPFAAEHDMICINKFMPPINSAAEMIHQATNSLAITLCKRFDPECRESNDNTYVFTIFHYKTYYDHDEYEPYIMMFKQSAPFEIHGISSKPIWYHGRGEAGGNWTVDAKFVPEGSTQMAYTTSMSWKQQGMTYHGFLDDVLFIAIGVEDEKSVGIDVVAGELMAGIALCE